MDSYSVRENEVSFRVILNLLPATLHPTQRVFLSLCGFPHSKQYDSAGLL